MYLSARINSLKFTSIYFLAAITIAVLVSVSLQQPEARAAEPSGSQRTENAQENIKRLTQLPPSERSTLLLEPLFNLSEQGSFDAAVLPAEEFSEYDSLQLDKGRLSSAAVLELVSDFELLKFGSRRVSKSAAGSYYFKNTGVSPVVPAAAPPEQESGAESEDTGAGETAQKVAPDSEGVVEGANSLFGAVSLSEAEIDLLRLSEPAAVFGYTQIRLDPGSEKPRRNFIFSPVIESLREVPGSHVGDPLLGFGISIDDLFSSGALKQTSLVQMAEPRLVAEKELLLPFSRGAVFLEPTEEEARQPDAEYRVLRGVYRRAGSEETSFNDVQRSSWSSGQSSPWIPDSTVFVKRAAVILEARSQSPFSPVGRTLTAFDQRSGLPGIRLKYNLSGDLTKILLYTWGLYRTGERRAGEQGTKTVKSVPFLVSLTAVEPQGGVASMFSTNAVKIHFASERTSVPKATETESKEEPGEAEEVDLESEDTSVVAAQSDESEMKEFSTEATGGLPEWLREARELLLPSNYQGESGQMNKRKPL